MANRVSILVRTLALSAALAVAGNAGIRVGAATAAGEAGEARAKEAATSLQRGQVEKATQLYTEALADTGLSNNRRASIYNDRGVAFARLNQSRVAIDDFNKAVQLAPETATIYNNRGNVLLAIGFSREAVKDFDRAILLASGYAAAYSNRANAYARLGESEAAIRDFSQAIRLTPQNAAAFAGRGRLHMTLNRPHAALRDFSRAVTHDGRFGAAYRARAETKLTLLRFDDAIEDFSRAVAFEPNSVDIYLSRGYAYLAAKNTASAIKDFTRASEINPRSSAAFEGLALANAKAEAYDDALNDIAKALEVEPRSAQAYAYRAVIYKWMGQPDIGVKDVERALKLEPQRPEVLWAKAEIAETTGQAPDAVADLRKAVAARPLLRDAVAALDRLGAGIPDEVEAKDLGFERWRVFVQSGRYYASHPELPRLSVPLEMMSDHTPRILEWDTKKIPVKGYAMLRFQAGQVEGKDGTEEIEHAVVIDLASQSVLAVETMQQGNRKSEWTWDDAKLSVKSPDGFTEDYVLRSKPKDVIAQQPALQQPRRVTSNNPGYGGPPSWAPWSQPWGGSGGGRQRQGSQPKGFFDLFFKGN